MPAPKKNDPVVEDGTVEDSPLDFVEPEQIGRAHV